VSLLKFAVRQTMNNTLSIKQQDLRQWISVLAGGPFIDVFPVSGGLQMSNQPLVLKIMQSFRHSIKLQAQTLKLFESFAR